MNVPVGRATTIGTLAACVGVAAFLGFAVAEHAVFAPAALALGFVVGAAILVNDRMRTIRRGA